MLNLYIFFLISSGRKYILNIVSFNGILVKHKGFYLGTINIRL